MDSLPVPKKLKNRKGRHAQGATAQTFTNLPQPTESNSATVADDDSEISSIRESEITQQRNYDKPKRGIMSKILGLFKRNKNEKHQFRGSIRRNSQNDSISGDSELEANARKLLDEVKNLKSYLENGYRSRQNSFTKKKDVVGDAKLPEGSDESIPDLQDLADMSGNDDMIVPKQQMPLNSPLRDHKHDRHVSSRRPKNMPSSPTSKPLEEKIHKRDRSKSVYFPLNPTVQNASDKPHVVNVQIRYRGKSLSSVQKDWLGYQVTRLVHILVDNPEIPKNLQLTNEKDDQRSLPGSTHSEFHDSLADLKLLDAANTMNIRRKSEGDKKAVQNSLAPPRALKSSSSENSFVSVVEHPQATNFPPHPASRAKSHIGVDREEVGLQNTTDHVQIPEIRNIYVDPVMGNGCKTNRNISMEEARVAPLQPSMIRQPSMTATFDKESFGVILRGMPSRIKNKISMSDINSVSTSEVAIDTSTPGSCSSATQNKESNEESSKESSEHPTPELEEVPNSDGYIFNRIMPQSIEMSGILDSRGIAPRLPQSKEVYDQISIPRQLNSAREFESSNSPTAVLSGERQVQGHQVGDIDEVPSLGSSQTSSSIWLHDDYYFNKNKVSTNASQKGSSFGTGLDRKEWSISKSLVHQTCAADGSSIKDKPVSSDCTLKWHDSNLGTNLSSMYTQNSRDDSMNKNGPVPLRRAEKSVSSYANERDNAEECCRGAHSMKTPAHKKYLGSYRGKDCLSGSNDAGKISSFSHYGEKTADDNENRDDPMTLKTSKNSGKMETHRISVIPKKRSDKNMISDKEEWRQPGLQEKPPINDASSSDPTRPKYDGNVMTHSDGVQLNKALDNYHYSLKNKYFCSVTSGDEIPKLTQFKEYEVAEAGEVVYSVAPRNKLNESENSCEAQQLQKNLSTEINHAQSLRKSSQKAATDEKGQHYTQGMAVHKNQHSMRRPRHGLVPETPYLDVSASAPAEADGAVEPGSPCSNELFSKNAVDQLNGACQEKASNESQQSSSKPRKWRQCVREKGEDELGLWWLPKDWAKERGIGNYSSNGAADHDKKEQELQIAKDANVEQIRMSRFVAL